MTASGGGGRRVPDPKACQQIAEQMLALALKAGADGAEVLVRDGTELTVKVRLGEPELIKEAGSRALGLRVLKDQRSAVTYTSDLTTAGLERLARDSVELAPLAEPDPIAALPPPEEMARDVPELDLWDEGVLSIDVTEGIRRARAGEAAALAFDKRVTNSDGAVFGRTVGASAFATSAGFRARFAARTCRSWSSRSATTPTARSATARTGPRRASPPSSPTRRRSGLEAARRTVAKLGSRKIATGAAPVIFSPDAARGLLGQFAGVMSGGAIWRQVELSGRPRGDADRVAARRDRRRSADAARAGLAAVRRRRAGQPHERAGRRRACCGTFLCDVYAARKLGRRSTGSAARGIGGSPHVGISNLILRPGAHARPLTSSGSSAGSTSPT